MKIGISQMSKKSPLALSRLRNGLIFLKIPTVAFLLTNHLVTEAASKVIENSIEYSLIVIAAVCIFSGRDIDNPPSTKSKLN